MADDERLAEDLYSKRALLRLRTAASFTRLLDLEKEIWDAEDAGQYWTFGRGGTLSVGSEADLDVAGSPPGPPGMDGSGRASMSALGDFRDLPSALEAQLHAAFSSANHPFHAVVEGFQAMIRELYGPGSRFHGRLCLERLGLARDDTRHFLAWLSRSVDLVLGGPLLRLPPQVLSALCGELGSTPGSPLRMRTQSSSTIASERADSRSSSPTGSTVSAVSFVAGMSGRRRAQWCTHTMRRVMHGRVFSDLEPELIALYASAYAGEDAVLEIKTRTLEGATMAQLGLSSDLVLLGLRSGDSSASSSSSAAAAMPVRKFSFDGTSPAAPSPVAAAASRAVSVATTNVVASGHMSAAAAAATAAAALQEAQRPVELAVANLQQMPFKVTPHGKLDCVLAALDTFLGREDKPGDDSMSDATSVATNANAVEERDRAIMGICTDDLITLLCYLILQAKVPRMYAQVMFIEDCLSETSTMMKLPGYLLTTFKAATCYVVERMDESVLDGSPSAPSVVSSDEELIDDEPSPAFLA